MHYNKAYSSVFFIIYTCIYRLRRTVQIYLHFLNTYVNPIPVNHDKCKFTNSLNQDEAPSIPASHLDQSCSTIGQYKYSLILNDFEAALESEQTLRSAHNILSTERLIKCINFDYNTVFFVFSDV